MSEERVSLGKTLFYLGVYWSIVLFIGEKAIELDTLSIYMFFWAVTLSPLLWLAENYLNSKKNSKDKHKSRRATSKK